MYIPYSGARLGSYCSVPSGLTCASQTLVRPGCLSLQSTSDIPIQVSIHPSLNCFTMF